MLKKPDRSVFEAATREFADYVDGIPRAAMDYRPFAEAWTCQEHVIHAVDSEVNAFLRLKTILGDPGTATFVLNEEAWTKNIDARGEKVEDYIELFRILRRIELNLLLRLDSRCENLYVVHPAAGKIDVSGWVDIYTVKHLQMHIEFMERNLKLFRDANGSASE